MDQITINRERLFEAAPFIHLTRQLESDIERIETLFDTDIFSNPITFGKSPFWKSVIIELIICTSDILQKCKKLDIPVEITEGLHLVGKSKNLTDMFSMVRNAACHIESKTHYVDQNNYNVATWNIEFTGSEYLEARIHFGIHSVLLVGHMWKAKEQAKANLALLIIHCHFPSLAVQHSPELGLLSLWLATLCNRYQLFQRFS
jgi:hypothetical protein